MKSIPMLAADLIEQLNKEVPHAKVVPGKTLDQLMFEAGKRELVDVLLLRLNTQIEDNQKKET